jgi:hypothetical protein
MAGYPIHRMMASLGRDLDRDVIEDGFNYMVENMLPELADEHGWSVRFNHCFRRICYDVAVGDKWDSICDRGPAYEHIALADLVTAYSCARMMAIVGEPVVTVFNEVSLMYREETDLEGNQIIGEEYWEGGE